jgi:hypothetical protein
MFALVSWNGKYILSIFQYYKLDLSHSKRQSYEVSDIFFELMARFRISCHHFKEEGNISLPTMRVFK